MRQSLKTHFRLMAEDRDLGLIHQSLKPLLSAASVVYGGLSGINKALYDNGILKRKRLPFPVISVGNITWGGAGKTPLVEYLARKVTERRRTPLVLTRGYSQDEVEQLKHHLPRVVLGVGKDRYRSGLEASKNKRINVAILDDGMQHWPIERDVEIVVVNAINPFGNGRLIPRGILREPATALKRAHIVVITHMNLIQKEELKNLEDEIHRLAPDAFIAKAYLEPLFFYRANKRKRVALQRLQDHRVTTFSGVGTPRSFQLLLSQCQIKPARNFEFTDHHQYTDSDLEEIKKVSKSASAEEIITTEKDFYRSSDQITKVLNPLILATRLRIASGEDVLTNRVFQLLGVQGT